MKFTDKAKIKLKRDWDANTVNIKGEVMNILKEVFVDENEKN